MLGASGALMVWGVDIEPQDLDIFVSGSDVKKLGEMFKEYVTNPLHEYNENGKDYLEFQMKVDGVDIEILELDFSLKDLEKVDFKGVPIPVNPLKKELEHYRKRVGLKDRILLIEKRLSELSRASKTIKRGEKFEHPHIIILMGLPGSGKSYVSDHLHNKYGYTILSGKNITFSLFGTEKVSGSDYVLAYKILRQLATNLLREGYSVVIDGTNLKYAFREQIYKEVGSKFTYLIYLVIDDETALRRANQRGENHNDKTNIKSSISSETFENFKTQLEEPRENEKGFKLISDDRLLDHLDKIVEQINKPQ